MRQKRVQLVCLSIFLLSFLGGDLATAFLSLDNRVYLTIVADSSSETEDSLEDETELKFSYPTTFQTFPGEQVSAPLVMEDRRGTKHPFVEIHSPPPE